MLFLHLLILFFYLLSCLRFNNMQLICSTINSFSSSSSSACLPFAMATASEQVFLWHCLTVMRINGVVLSTSYMEYDILDHITSHTLACIPTRAHYAIILQNNSGCANRKEHMRTRRNGNALSNSSSSVASTAMA